VAMSEPGDAAPSPVRFTPPRPTPGIKLSGSTRSPPVRERQPCTMRWRSDALRGPLKHLDMAPMAEPKLATCDPALVLRDSVRRILADVFAPLRARGRALPGLRAETADQSRTWLCGCLPQPARPRRPPTWRLRTVRRTLIGWIGKRAPGRYPDEGELGFGYILHPPTGARSYALRRSVPSWTSLQRSRGAAASACAPPRTPPRRGCLTRPGLRFSRRTRHGAEEAASPPRACNMRSASRSGAPHPGRRAPDGTLEAKASYPPPRAHGPAQHVVSDVPLGDGTQRCLTARNLPPPPPTPRFKTHYLPPSQSAWTDH
jgi:hypothetical protein